MVTVCGSTCIVYVLILYLVTNAKRKVIRLSNQTQYVITKGMACIKTIPEGYNITITAAPLRSHSTQIFLAAQLCMPACVCLLVGFQVRNYNFVITEATFTARQEIFVFLILHFAYGIVFDKS